MGWKKAHLPWKPKDKGWTPWIGWENGPTQSVRGQDRRTILFGKYLSDLIRK